MKFDWYSKRSVGLYRFYRASAYDVLLTHDIDIAILSVCLSVTFRYSMETV